MTKKQLQVWTGQLPASAADIVKRNPRSVRQHVEHVLLNGAWSKGVPFMNATTDENSVTGKLQFDDCLLAQAVHDYGDENADKVILGLSLAELHKEISAIRNANKIGRAQRRKAQELAMLTHAPGEELPVTDNG